MTRPDPVFIVGAPRSGTSILYRTLLKHSSFAVQGPVALQLSESGLLDSLHAAPRWKAPRPPRLWRFFLEDSETYGRFLADVQSVVGDAAPASPDSAPPWTGPVLDSFVTRATEARSCRRLVEKTPTHIERAEWLLDARPDARLLFIHRHPLDTYTSYLRRATLDPRATWADLDAEEFALVYSRQSQHARRLATNHPDRFLTLGYEAFTAYPVRTTEKVCGFLGEAFQPSMVEEANPDLTRSRNDPLLFGEITASPKAWNDFVDLPTAIRVENQTEEAAGEWGYRRYTSPEHR